ncbi:MAG: hypothetical protein K2I18_10120 [Paramuribaculum sp.]|nr:hypothetical protein [Paramuribaculum sp.]
MSRTFLKTGAIALLATVAMTSCNDDNGNNWHEPTPVTSGLVVVNQGDYYNNIPGNLTYFDYATSSAKQNAYSAANSGNLLGDTPQDAIVYGSKMYVAIYDSNLIRVLDRKTLELIEDITPDATTGTQPRSMAVDNGKVYISMYDGKVARLDTASLTLDASVAVGPNPEGVAILKGKLYVANSDGMNWQSNYANGKTLSVIDLSSFTVEKTLPVGLNPGPVVATSNYIYVIAKGDYASIPSTLQRVDPSGNVTDIAPATLMCGFNDNILYANAVYGVGPEKITYTLHNTLTGNSSPMIFNEIQYPAALAIDPVTANIVITSYTVNNGYADYTSNGYAVVYSNGNVPVAQFPAGLNPCAIAFNTGLE